MATLCPNGHEIAEGTRFCPVCGVRLAPLSEEDVPNEDITPKVASPMHRAKPTIWASTAMKWREFGWKAKTAIIATVVLFVLALLGSAMGGSGSDATLSSDEDGEPTTSTTATSPKPPKPKPQKPKGYVGLLLPGMTPQRAARPVCSKYRAAISSWSAVADERLASSSGATADAYAASDYQGDVAWLSQSHAQSFDKSIYTISRARLRIVTRRGLTPEMVTRFSKDAVWLCKLSKDSKRVSDKLDRLDSRADRISALASRVPWYPRGYNAWGDNIAWQWIDDNDCGYSDGYCWGLWVISLDGCPSGLYAEVNILSGSTVIDYSNDALGSLSASDVAKLDFVSFQEGYGTLSARIADISCY